MNGNDFGSYGRPQKHKPVRQLDGTIEYSLNGERQILQSISSRLPLARVLNDICSALDRQIGSIVSLIFFPEDNSPSLAEIERNAAVFGLYVFFSADILAGSGEELGSVEMYCCMPRSPSAQELQLIERAACLAAIAMERNADASHPAGEPGSETARSITKWTGSIN